MNLTVIFTGLIVLAVGIFLAGWIECLDRHHKLTDGDFWAGGVFVLGGALALIGAVTALVGWL